MAPKKPTVASQSRRTPTVSTYRKPLPKNTAKRVAGRTQFGKG